MAGFVVMFLLAGHVLAATGLCVVTAPGEPAQMHESSAACPEHGPQAGQGHGSTVKHHCPAEEPSPQSRSADLPVAQPVAAIASVHTYLLDPPVGRLLQPTPDHQVPPPPLYARLQRLRL
ncbi:MAG: hypothetical protein WBA53_07335 [Burkholderiaceae bacterium]